MSTTKHKYNGGERSSVSVDRQYHMQRYAATCDDERRRDSEIFKELAVDY